MLFSFLVNAGLNYSKLFILRILQKRLIQIMQSHILQGHYYQIPLEFHPIRQLLFRHFVSGLKSLISLLQLIFKKPFNFYKKIARFRLFLGTEKMLREI